MTDLSKSQLNAILSALDGQPRNPNTKDAALRRIGAHAERLGISLDALLAAAAGLLDGRMSAEQFRTCLQDDAAEAAGRIEPIEEKAACIETRCAAPAPAGESNSEQNSATAAADEGAPLATGTAEAGGQEPTSDEPAAKARKHRDGTKEAMLIDMLRRPRGRHHRADHRGDRLAGAHRPRRLRRRAEAQARPHRHLREAGRRRAGVPHCRLTRRYPATVPAKEKPPGRFQGAFQSLFCSEQLS